MAYQKQNFVNGQVLTADHMNHIEDGIAAVVQAVDDTVVPDVNQLKLDIGDLQTALIGVSDLIGGDA